MLIQSHQNVEKLECFMQFGVQNVQKHESFHYLQGVRGGRAAGLNLAEGSALGGFPGSSENAKTSGFFNILNPDSLKSRRFFTFLQLRACVATL